MKNYIYVFVREDLSRPQQTVQAGHALIEAQREWPYQGEHPSVIVLGVPNEDKLIGAYFTVSDNFDCWAFREPDRNNEMTAFATRPIKEYDRQFFRKWQLLK